MYLCYFDESGDDGYKQTSSELFVLTCVYFHYSAWKENYETILGFRRLLKDKFSLPVKMELHTREFILDKGIYHNKYPPIIRRKILAYYGKLILSLDIKIINVCIVKNKINRPTYDILKNALTYNVQRIENDLNYLRNDSKFMIITDEGRLAKMRRTTRSIQKINFIPSQFGPFQYRKEIKNMIEDPLPKKSSESYFIQLADMMAFVIGLYAKQNLSTPKIPWGKRILNVLNYGDETKFLNFIKPKLNLKANSRSPFGIVCYPN